MRRLLPLLSLVLTGSFLAAVPAPASAAPARPIAYTQWDTPAELRSGRLVDTRVTRGTIVQTKAPSGRRKVDGTAYELGHWLSPWTKPGFALTELIGSWSATTTGDSWIEVSVRGRAAGGGQSSWDVLGRWTSGDTFTRRTSVGGQGDDLADVNVDTWKAPRGMASYQLRVSLARRAGTKAKAVVDTVGAVASRLPSGPGTTSKPGVARGIVLDVPRYSQMIHQGHSPQWGGGGQAWCSPTSTSMVLGYYGALPKAADHAWVGAGHQNPWVDHAARMTYDAAYRGTGNWPFNTAYAAPLAGHAFVTRLRSLREAERLIKAGIPVVASVSFGRGQLSGAPISATNGHLLVIVGFTQSGDVVVNDPAASSSAGVRRTYDRAQFESVWLPTSGGLAYVIHDDAHPLPSSNGTW
ncbi:C39 family peptidase [Nocardioides marmotae]|uniref:C39 family peptidase n=1 Tax=Nocardioides marmotae TaxID=2663857 RepID=UPI0012B64135|nr:C39 family peptidase [Nocardioides marmotae]MBC9734819.1 C39 family peptidase [Nocardioides marmotae]MTB85920.1 peptidase C39 family protein [Nocardioides marmotae]